VPFSGRPPLLRDCVECGAPDGMELQNTSRTQPTNIPLLYTCRHCACTLTIPPHRSPLLRPSNQNEK
jgi:hypothetical protein